MSAPGRHARPRLSWYLLPLPLAVLIAVAMPWVAVREVRRSSRAFRQLLDILLAARQCEQDRQPGQADAPKPRHLTLVR